MNEHRRTKTAPEFHDLLEVADTAAVDRSLAAEANNPMSLYLVSFAGDEQPLGACFVEARGHVSAARRAVELGIHPPGAVAISYEHPKDMPQPAPEFVGRYLDKEAMVQALGPVCVVDSSGRAMGYEGEEEDEEEDDVRIEHFHGSITDPSFFSNSIEDSVLRAMIEVALKIEAEQPEVWYYISYTSEVGFLGGCLVRARGPLSAVKAAKELDITPGNCNAAVMEYNSNDPLPGAQYQNRLLTLQEMHVAFPQGVMDGEGNDVEPPRYN